MRSVKTITLKFTTRIYIIMVLPQDFINSICGITTACPTITMEFNKATMVLLFFP